MEERVLKQQFSNSMQNFWAIQLEDAVGPSHLGQEQHFDMWNDNCPIFPS